MLTTEWIFHNLHHSYKTFHKLLIPLWLFTKVPRAHQPLCSLLITLLQKGWASSDCTTFYHITAYCGQTLLTTSIPELVSSTCIAEAIYSLQQVGFKQTKQCSECLCTQSKGSSCSASQLPLQCPGAPLDCQEFMSRLNMFGNNVHVPNI